MPAPGPVSGRSHAEARSQPLPGPPPETASSPADHSRVPAAPAPIAPWRTPLRRARPPAPLTPEAAATPDGCRCSSCLLPLPLDYDDPLVGLNAAQPVDPTVRPADLQLVHHRR